jgi:hypothetical protein
MIFFPELELSSLSRVLHLLLNQSETYCSAAHVLICAMLMTFTYSTYIYPGVRMTDPVHIREIIIT